MLVTPIPLSRLQSTLRTGRRRMRTWPRQEFDTCPTWVPGADMGSPPFSILMSIERFRWFERRAFHAAKSSKRVQTGEPQKSALLCHQTLKPPNECRPFLFIPDRVAIFYQHHTFNLAFLSSLP